MADQPDILAPAMKHYKAGRLEESEALLRRLLHRGEQPSRVTLLLAQVLSDRQRPDAAAFELERLIRARPAEMEPRMALASVWMAVGNNQRAGAALDEVTRQFPNAADAWAAMGTLAMQSGRIVDAEAHWRRALSIDPTHGGSMVWLAQALSGTLRAREAVELVRAELRARPGRAGLQQVLAFVLQYADDATPEEVFREQRQAGRLVAHQAGGMPPRVAVDADPERRLTIGYLSPDFRAHPVASFIRPILAAHDRSRYRVIAYSSTKARDEVTRTIRGLVDEWREVLTLDDTALAALMAQDRVDIAVDLAGHTRGSRITALVLRPAPVCITYIGYPNTTGVPGIDYRIVDWKTDPPGAEALATETLLRLDECFLCFLPPDQAPPVGPPPSGLAGHITFGSFNAADKLSPACAALWSRVMREVRGSRLLLKSGKLDDPGAHERVIGRFTQHGIDAARIDLRGALPSACEHLGLYGSVDLALDTFPYNGTTTTCEAMWMGVPVVALEGNMHAGRVGVSLLSAVGLPDLIARTPDEFVRIATGLAGDPARLAAVRAGLRPRMAASPLCDGPGHTRRYEAALRDVWGKWCATRG